jgi:hypothetical protein
VADKSISRHRTCRFDTPISLSQAILSSKMRLAGHYYLKSASCFSGDLPPCYQRMTPSYHQANINRR